MAKDLDSDAAAAVRRQEGFGGAHRRDRRRSADDAHRRSIRDLRKQLFNDEGKLRSFVNVYLNDEDIRYLSKDATPVKDGDTLSIVPSIAGGSYAG